MLRFNAGVKLYKTHSDLNLNTYHVKVQCFRRYFFNPLFIYLNTYHVKVQLLKVTIQRLLKRHLNTYHVKVQYLKA